MEGDHRGGTLPSDRSARASNKKRKWPVEKIARRRGVSRRIRREWKGDKSRRGVRINGKERVEVSRSGERSPVGFSVCLAASNGDAARILRQLILIIKAAVVAATAEVAAASTAALTAALTAAAATRMTPILPLGSVFLVSAGCR